MFGTTHQTGDKVTTPRVNGSWYAHQTGTVVGHRMGDEITVVRFVVPAYDRPNYIPAYDGPITSDVALPTALVVSA